MSELVFATYLKELKDAWAEGIADPDLINLLYDAVSEPMELVNKEGGTITTEKSAASKIMNRQKGGNALKVIRANANKDKVRSAIEQYFEKNVVKRLHSDCIDDLLSNLKKIIEGDASISEVKKEELLKCATKSSLAEFLGFTYLYSLTRDNVLKEVRIKTTQELEDYKRHAGLITRAIYVNEGVDERKQITNDYDYLIELADEKRKEIQAGYDLIKTKIRPLVLIQFPMGQPETIAGVEAKLERMGYTYDNGMVSIWMSDAKKNIDGLTENDGSPAFLLMKQAISTGWDCPRAKILVKLREGGSEDFQIQTIGRIRRMPERKHYGLNTLDYCYIYTLDSRYKMGLLSSMDKAYQVRRLFARDETKSLVLTKELRNLDFDGLGERETLEKVYEYFKKKYNLGNDMRVNRENLAAGGYNFDHEIDSKILQGLFRTTEELASGIGKNNVTIKTAVNTHSHGIYLLHSVDEIKKVTGLQSQKAKNILRRMFSKGKKTKYKFVALDNSDFYAFIINNVKQLKIDFKECTAQMGGRQMSFVLEPKQAEFSIPEMEIYKYSEVKQRQLMRLNAYLEYTNEFITDKTRSMPERLFERYCETRADKIEWVYKNGDTGQQYLSIVYLDGFLKQWLFYPDYIVKTNDGQVWLIETKGGEVAGHSKNIDIQVENKFIAFKQYAEKYKLNFGFVRDINEDLFINNTEYHEDMSHDSWRPLGELL